MKTTRLTGEAEATIQKHAEASFPDECCGFLYGSEDAGIRTIREARQVTNSKEGDKMRRFEISAEDYMKAEKHALESGQALLGVYHSHPGHPAIPSEHDRRQAVPYFSYVVASVISGRTDHIRSWKLNDGRQFEEEDLRSENTVLRNKQLSNFTTFKLYN